MNQKKIELAATIIDPRLGRMLAPKAREVALIKAKAIAELYHRPWALVSAGEFPRDEWIEVAGDSGYTRQKWFVAVAKHDAEYRPLNPWIDVQNNGLSDCGWTPLLWRPLDLPAGIPKDYETPPYSKPQPALFGRCPDCPDARACSEFGRCIADGGR